MHQTLYVLCKHMHYCFFFIHQIFHEIHHIQLETKCKKSLLLLIVYLNKLLTIFFSLFEIYNLYLKGTMSACDKSEIT
jgi:hypothetical protein